MDYKGNYTVIGPPGTGKTTYMAKRVQRVAETHPHRTIAGGTPALVCSLTKAAAAQAAGKSMPVPKEAVATMHAHGWRAQGSPPLAEVAVDEFNKAHPGLAISSSTAKSDDDVIGPQGVGSAPGDEYAAEYHHMRHACTPRHQWDSGVQAWALKWEAWKQEAGVCDFTDMIDHAPEEAPMDPAVVFVDEAQDMSKLEFLKLRQWGKSAGAMVTVGDPYQALYKWRGAHPEYLLDDMGDDERFGVLSQSYRVPGAIHARAMDWIRNINGYTPLDYKPTPEPGLVDYCGSDFKTPYSAIDLAQEKVAEGKSVMMITSCNYMTNPIVHELRSQGIPFSNPWRETNRNWNPIGPRKGTSMASRVQALMAGPRWTMKQFDLWTSCMQVKGLLNRGARQEIESHAQQFPQLVITDEQLHNWCYRGDMFTPSRWDLIWNHFQNGGDEGELYKNWIAGMKPESRRSAAFVTNIARASGVQSLTEKPKLHVGTIHSFKGGEADVVILFPDISYASYEGYINPTSEGYDSVIRGFYVGMTRASQELHLCQPEGKLAVSL